jgi:tetratricopeptide (TPR) repeat protein
VSPVVVKRVVHQRAKGPIDPAFGKRIKDLRVARGMTQADLAGNDFSKGFISLVETGRTRTSLRAAEVLARKLDIPVTELVSTPTGNAREAEFAVLRVEQELSAGRPAAAIAGANALEPKVKGVLRTRLKQIRARGLIETGRPGDALRPLDEARREFEQFGRKDMVARVLVDLGRAHAQLDQPGEGLHYLLAAERALDAGEIVDRTLELHVHRMLSNVYIRLGDFQAADMRADRARAIAEEVSDPATLAQLYAGIAIARQERGDFEAAITYARRSLDQYEQLEQRAAVGRTWNNLAWLYIQRAQYGKAKEAIGRAEGIAQETSDHLLAGWTAATRAELLLARGKAAEAIVLADSVASNAQLSSRVRAEASLLKARGHAAQKTSLSEIRRAFEDTLQMHRDEPARLRARVHHEFARALAARGAMKDAYEEESSTVELLQPREK